MYYDDLSYYDNVTTDDVLFFGGDAYEEIYDDPYADDDLLDDDFFEGDEMYGDDEESYEYDFDDAFDL